MDEISLESRVDVLLATRNGERFVGEQIGSILAQTHRNFRLLVHDDGSSDNTIRIIENIGRDDARIEVINDGVTCGGAARNFFHLLSWSSAPYVAFCDQDDIWTMDHLEELLNGVKEEEARGSSRPVAAFGDLVVVNERMEMIEPSLWKAFRVKLQKANDARYIAVGNICTGCCMLLNRPAVELVLSLDYSQAVMHDHFIPLAIISRGMGVLVPVPKQLVYYRQHSVNTIGAALPGIKTSLNKLWNARKTVNRITSYYNQSKYIGIHRWAIAFIFDKLYYRVVYTNAVLNLLRKGRAYILGADKHFKL